MGLFTCSVCKYGHNVMNVSCFKNKDNEYGLWIYYPENANTNGFNPSLLYNYGVDVKISKIEITSSRIYANTNIDEPYVFTELP